MPYSYHKQGDQYIVTKKDTGKEVGRTKGTKEALNKYLAALHINANENKTMKKSELTKMIQEVIKEVLSERSTNKVNEAGDMFVSGGNINPELIKKVEQFVKNIAKYYDYSVDDAFLAIMTILKGGIRKETVNETYTTIKIGDIVSKKYASTDEDYTKEFKVIDITGTKATLQDTNTGKKTGIALSDLTKIPMKEATTDYMKRRQAQDDYATNKKDAPKKQSKMPTSTGKTDYMKRREAEKKMQEAAPTKAKDLGLSEKGYFKVKFPAGTREEALKSIESLLKSDQAKYTSLKVDIMPLKKEEDKDFAVIKLNGEGAHTVGLKMKAAYKDKAGFKGATIKPYHPTFQSK